MSQFVRRPAGPVLALTLLLAGVPAAASTLYNVQFAPSTANRQTGAAVIGASGDYWNMLTAAGTSLLTNSAGVPSGVSLVWTGSGPFGSSIVNPNFGNGDTNLMDGYMYSLSSGSLSFSSLATNAAFTLYVYSQGDSAATGRRISVTGNGTTVTSAAGVAGTTSFVNGQNYLILSGTTTAGGTLLLTYTNVSGEADINGLQLLIATVVPPTNAISWSGIFGGGGTGQAGGWSLSGSIGQSLATGFGASVIAGFWPKDLGTNRTITVLGQVVLAPQIGSLNTTTNSSLNIAAGSGNQYGITSISRPAANTVSLILFGQSGSSYLVERSLDLSAWKVIWTTNAPASGNFYYADNFLDLNGQMPGAAFYRLVKSSP